MTKTCKIPNKLYSDSVFWIFRIGDLFVSEFVSVRGAAFDIRISEFVSLMLRRDQWTYPDFEP
jgi:hypothetical protein